MCGSLHAYLKGFDINDDTLGIDSLAEGGPGQHMFGSAHTMSHYETAYWDTEIHDDQTYEAWSDQGSLDAMARANARWKQSLASYQAPPLDEAIDEALKEFITRRKTSMEDSWY